MILARLGTMTFCAILTVAGPALAQDQAVSADEGLSCGSHAASWIGESPEASDIAGADAPLADALELPGGGGEARYYAFRVGGEQPQPLRLEVEALDGGDSTIALLDAQGDVIDENDDAAGTLSSRIEPTLDPGDYCLRVRGWADEALNATVQIGRAADHAPLLAERGDGSIAACTPDTQALDLADGPLNAALAGGDVAAAAPASPVGYLRFTLSEPAALTLRAGSDDVDPKMALFDAEGRQIGENDDADGLNARLDMIPALPAGQYCIGVASFGGDEGEIEVSARLLDEGEYLAREWRAGTMVPPAGSDYPVTQVDLAGVRQHALLLGGEAKWFSFRVDRASVMIIGAYGSLAGADPALALFSARGEVLAENDDHGSGLDARVGPVLLEPGQYHVAVTNTGASGEGATPVRPVSLVFDQFVRVE